MGVFQIAIILAAFLCSLVAGFLFAFAIVTMPGIRSLNDQEFLRAFQVMDRVIQNKQPLFIFGLGRLSRGFGDFGCAWRRAIGWNWASAHDLRCTRLSSWRPIADRHD